MFGFETVIEIVIPRNIYMLDFSQTILDTWCKDTCCIIFNCFGLSWLEHVDYSSAIYSNCVDIRFRFVCIRMLVKTPEQIWLGFSKLWDWWRKRLIFMWEKCIQSPPCTWQETYNWGQRLKSFFSSIICCLSLKIDLLEGKLKREFLFLVMRFDLFEDLSLFSTRDSYWSFPIFSMVL